MFIEKTKTYRNKRYLEFVRTLPCCVCKGYSEAHHSETGGMAVKCNDTRAIPLCHRCHHECHAIGKGTFQERHNIDFRDIQICCLETYIIFMSVN